MKNSKNKVKLLLLIPVIVAAGFTLAGCTKEIVVEDPEKPSIEELILADPTERWDNDYPECKENCEEEMLDYIACYNDCLVATAERDDDYTYCTMMYTDTTEQSVVQGECVSEYAKTWDEPSYCGKVTGLAKDLCYSEYVAFTDEFEYCDEIEAPEYKEVCAGYKEVYE